MSEIYDVAVIGGGLHGLSAALQLARRGSRVILLERSWIGRHASGATAAGVRTLGRDPRELPIALESAELWRRLKHDIGDDCGFKAAGQLQVAEDARGLARIEARVTGLRAQGYAHEEVIDRSMLHRLAPGIARHCIGAAWVGTDGSADPHRTLAAYRRSAEAAGVVIREGVAVRGLAQTNAGWRIEAGMQVEAGAVVNAAGAWADRLAHMVGDDIELGVKASMMMITERLGRFVEPVVSAIGRPLSFKQVDQGGLLIGGGVQGHPDIDGGVSRPDFLRLAAGARAAAELFPAVAEVNIARVWAGLEAKTRDLLPVIGPSPSAPGIFHVFGFSGHGFQLVPVAGFIIADLVLRGGTNRSIAAFAPERLMHTREAA